MFSRRIHSAVHAMFAGDDLARLVKAVPSDIAVSPEAVLVYPGEDLQGDIVEPDGGDWTAFQRGGCLVNFEHGPHIGYGEVTLKSIPLTDGTKQNVPVGVTTFFRSAADLRNQRLPKYDSRGNVIGSYSADECLRVAEQVAPLVADGTLNGVSVEFRPSGPKGQAYDEIGPSPLLDRPACHFREWHGLGWAAACEMPVNPNARYVLTDSQQHRAEKAFKVCEDPNTLAFVRKSLTPLASLARDPRRVTVAMSQHNKGLFGGVSSKLAKKFPKRKRGLGRVGATLLAGGGMIAGAVGGMALARNPRVQQGARAVGQNLQTGAAGVGHAVGAVGSKMRSVGNAVGGKMRSAGQGVANAVGHGVPTMHSARVPDPSGQSAPAWAGTFGQRNPKRPGGTFYAGTGHKAFDPAEQPPEPETPVDETHDDTDHADLPEGMTHTPATCHQVAQSLLDVSQMGEELLAHSEHPEAKAKLADIIARARALAEEAKALGDDTHAELSGGEKPAEPEPIKTDESGAIESKSFGPHWRPVRLTAADLGPPVTKKGRAADEEGLSLADQKYLLAELKRLRGSR